MKLLLCAAACLIIMIVFYACRPVLNFDRTPKPPPPEYADEKYWFALPWRNDIADTVPVNCPIPENQAKAQADVFYIHPTLYFRGRSWNADLRNKRVNKKSGLSVQHQATVFNASCRVFAPRYRQAVLKSFFNEKRGKKPVELAYSDIRAAFLYYLERWNEGRPIIIAGHSQGARHAVTLLKEFFDGKELQDKLVAAYPVGFPFKADELKNISLSTNEKQTGCYVTWNTFLWGAKSKTQKKLYAGVPCLNPLLMKVDSSYAPIELNKGSVTFKEFKVIQNACDAQVHGNVLWIHKPRHKGFIRIGKTYHLFDVNLFYMNIRENVGIRIAEYLAKHK